jgi:hypothetical protein
MKNTREIFKRFGQYLRRFSLNHYSLITIHSHRKGQALIEIILLLPLLVIIMSMITWYTRVLLTKQMLLTSARYGTDMMYYSRKNEFGADKVEHWIKIYLSDSGIEGRRLVESKIKVKVTDKRPDGVVTAFNAGQPINPFGLHNEASVVEVAYELSMPTIFTAFSAYIPNAGELPNSITVAARSAVLAGTMSPPPE